MYFILILLLHILMNIREINSLESIWQADKINNISCRVFCVHVLSWRQEIALVQNWMTIRVRFIYKFTGIFFYSIVLILCWFKNGEDSQWDICSQLSKINNISFPYKETIRFRLHLGTFYIFFSSKIILPWFKEDIFRIINEYNNTINIIFNLFS
jgi:hypothetical protein